jgi:hypothetical protein
MSPPRDATEELLALNQRLLEGIANGNWETYAELCDPTITAFEPEARGNLVQGLEFHHFYFNLGASPGPNHTTMAAPHVRMLGPDAAVVSYVRLVQRLDEAKHPVTVRSEETRVWMRRDGKWRHVHFHRSVG